MRPLIRRTLTITGIILAVGVTAASWYLTQAIPIGTGYVAKYLCSAVFISGRDPDAVFREDVTPVNPLAAVVSLKIDRPNKRVTADSFGLFKAAAVYREGCGCTLAVGVSEDALRNQDIAASAPATKLPDELPWPEGNGKIAGPLITARYKISRDITKIASWLALLLLSIFFFSLSPSISADCIPYFSYKDGWYGGDGAYSIKLDEKRTLWIFGDTFVSGEQGRQDRIGMDVVLGTTLGISTCSENGEFEIQYYVKKTNEKFISSFSENEWLWPQDPFIANSTLYVPLLVVEAKPDMEGPFKFKIAGHKIAKITNFEAGRTGQMDHGLHRPDTRNSGRHYCFCNNLGILSKSCIFLSVLCFNKGYSDALWEYPCPHSHK